jgi:hypothetical protein
MKILNEQQTLDAALSGVSLSRFGDGELRLATGGTASSQRNTSPQMMRELAAILAVETPGLLVCIPDFNAHGPRRAAWQKYVEPRYAKLYGKQTYGSAFVTRPDNAPWINVPEYWELVRNLWRDKDVTLVVGDRKSITEQVLQGNACARSIRTVWGPRVEAYAEIDRIERDVMQAHRSGGTVIICLGVTATILAWRLAKRHVHALDLGHIGMFMKHAGSYRYQPDDLSTGIYRRQLHKLHTSEKWGGDGKKHADTVIAFADELAAQTILDYGCGRGTLNKRINDPEYLYKPRRIMEYDPGVEGKTTLPKPADLVVCTDVLEHVEPDKVDAVLQHLFCLTGKGAYLTIATREARHVLPDGRNAHLTIQPAEWWMNKVAGVGYQKLREENKPGHEVKLWLTRQ